MRKKPLDVRSYYDQYAPRYDNFYEKIQIQKFSWCKEYFNIDDTGWFVDLGGGTGNLSKWLNYAFVTLDISFNMLLEGLTKDRRFFGIACDISKIPIRNSSVRLILSFTSIQNLEVPISMLTEVKRIMKNKCTGVITALAKVTSLVNLVQWAKAVQLETIAITLPLEDVGIAFKNEDQ